MIISEMLICSLVFVSPYYDCSEQWKLYWYDDITVETPSGRHVFGYALIYAKEIHVGIIKKDFCGQPLLWHELQHLKYNTSTHEWMDRSKCIKQ